ncbi:hypothetical protein ACMFMF_001794 [Clarireedia jacksonii]
MKEFKDHVLYTPLYLLCTSSSIHPSIHPSIQYQALSLLLPPSLKSISHPQTKCKPGGAEMFLACPISYHIISYRIASYRIASYRIYGYCSRTDRPYSRT